MSAETKMPLCGKCIGSGVITSTHERVTEWCDCDNGRQARIADFFADAGEWENVEWIDPSECTREHRWPQGPNEDMASCPACLSMTFCMRPEGETYGWHLDDCSLPMRHPGYCAPGGAGHVIPDGEKIRGYFPPEAMNRA